MSKKTALIINPWATDFKLYDEWMHPIGLYFLVSLLKHNNFTVTYFNCLDRSGSAKPKYCNTGNFETREIPKPEIYKTIKRKYKLYGRPRKDLESFLSATPYPDIICIGSGMTYWLPGLVETVNVVGGYFPDTPLVIGGVSAKLIPEHIKAAVPKANIFQGSLLDDSSIRQSSIPLIATLNTASWKPSFIDAYRHITLLHHAPVLSSLGCPMSCSYCASRILQSEFVIRRQQTVLDEIEFAKSHFNIRNFALFDDAVLHLPEQNAIPLFNAIIRQYPDIRFHTPNGLHLKSLTPQILCLMKQAGFQTLRMGYESGDMRYNKDTSAKASHDELTKKIKMALDTGFDNASIGIYIMAGLSGQLPADVIKEIEFAASLSVKVKPVFLSPVPHTPLYEKYAAIFPELNADPLQHNDTFFITRLPGWNAEEAQRIMDTAKKYNVRLDTKQ
jgi:radical SAM superfamily enzyme YgiQ (UPF0313 family)